MLSQLAEVTYNYNYDYTTSSADAGVSAAFMFIMFLIFLPLIVFSIVCMWKVFVKAGEAGWKSIVPIYNMWIMAELAGKPGWWAFASLLSVIPFVGWIGTLVVYAIIYLEFAKAFGKDTAFGILLLLLPVIGFAILAFGPAKYVGTKFDTLGSNGGGAKPQTPPAAPAA